MELRPRLSYSSEEELKQWTLLLEKARVDGPESLLFDYEGGEITFEGPCRTAEDRRSSLYLRHPIGCPVRRRCYPFSKSPFA